MTCYAYVFPCGWEDHCKVGFSGNPLSRLRQLHRRWFEFFDVERGRLVETETVRDARDVELELRRLLVAYNAPAPLTVRREGAGHTEWYRGASTALDDALAALARRAATACTHCNPGCATHCSRAATSCTTGRSPSWPPTNSTASLAPRRPSRSCATNSMATWRWDWR